MNKKPLIFGICIFIFLISITSVSAVPTGGVLHYNVNENVEDQWNSYDGLVSGMTYITTYPSFNITGDGATHAGNFDGINDDVNIGWGVGNILPSGDEITISVWIYPQKAGATQRLVYDTSAFGLFIGISNYIGWRLEIDGTKYLASTTNYNLNDWNHIVGTYDDSNLKLYINGELEDTEAITGDFTAFSDVHLGSTGSSQWYDGYIDEVKIYDRFLNSTEVQNLYNYGNESYSPPELLELTAEDNESSASITDFNATIDLDNGTTGLFYSTDNGTINTGINQSLNLTANITFQAENYFDQTYTDYNTSNDLEGVLLEYPKITAIQSWTNNSINVSNVTISDTVYSTTNGTIYVPYTNSQEVIARTADHFDINRTLNFENSTDYELEFKQSEITFEGRTLFTNISLSNWTLTLNGTQILNITGNQSVSYPTAGTWDAELTSNDGSFFKYNTTVTINPLDNKTIYVYAYLYELNITAKDMITGLNISNFTVIVDSQDRVDYRTYNTTAGLINVPLCCDTYELTLNADGYALFRRNFTLNTSTSYEFEVYTTNSFNLTFYDFSTQNLISDINITIEFIGSTAINRTTDTGSVYVDLLVPDEYTFVFSAPGYRQNQYIMTLNNRTYEEIDLYLNLENQTNLILINVQDKFGQYQEDVKITVQRYQDSSWKTEQILMTDFQGRTEGQFVLSTVYYNFILEKDGINYFGSINNDENKKIIFAEDVSNGLLFTIDVLESGLLSGHYNTYDVLSNLTYISLTNTSGYFRYSFVDPNSNQWTACLEVTKGGSREVICDCEDNKVTSSSSGIMTCSISNPEGRDYFVAKANFEGGSTVDDLMTYIGQNTSIDWGMTGYVIAFFLVVVSAFLFIKMPSYAVIVATGVFVACGMIGLIFRDTVGAMDIGIYIVLLVISFLIARIKSDSSGLEGT